MNTHDKFELPPLPQGEYRLSPDSRAPTLYDEEAMEAYARAAIKSDLQRSGEPVAWMYEHDGCMAEPFITTKRWKVCAEPWNETPLYNCQHPAEPSGAPTLHNKDSGAQDGIHAPQPAERQTDAAQLVEALEGAA